MHNLIQQLVTITQERLEDEVSERQSLKFIKNLNLLDCIATSIEVIYLYTRQDRGETKNPLFTEIALNIGRKIRKGLKKDSGLNVKTGAFFLYTFEMTDIIRVQLGVGNSKHATYIVEVLDEEILSKLWDKLDFSHTVKLPSTKPLAPWTSSKHPVGLNLVKTQDQEVLLALTPKTHPIVFNCVNSAQEIGWTINEPVYQLFAWSIRNRTESLSDIWEMQNDQAKASKLREAHAIGNIASKLIDKVFYHYHTLDFRGRLYVSTAYLNHQGTDLAKALLLRAESKPLGAQGFFWLLVSIATHWGNASHIPGRKTDKIPLQERAIWVKDNEEIILSYATSPKTNTGWHKADKPWQFIAACIELRKVREWQAYMRISNPHFDEYGFSSSFTGWLDGSTNGVQHLSALSKDEVVAPYANLVPSQYPGDLYAYVAEHVWATVNKAVEALPPGDKEQLDNVIDNMIELRKAIGAAEKKSDKRKEAVDALYEFRASYANALKSAAPVYWSRITDSKQRRKIAKRGVMTISYGSTAYGMADQVLDDARKHGIDLLLYMEKTFGVYMGRLIYDDCKVSLNRPMKLLELFEQAGERAEARNQFLSWKLPITHFPVVQHYVEGTVKKVYVNYWPPEGMALSNGYYSNTLQIAVPFNELPQNSQRKQRLGAAPNIVHSLDAAHLMLVVDRAAKEGYRVTTVHDSFGALLSDMDHLFKNTRETFVELYETDPLVKIMKAIGGDIKNVDRGSLDISLILESEYAFS